MKERTPKDFGKLMIIAFAWALMVVGCLASCRTPKRGYVNATCWEHGEKTFIDSNIIKGYAIKKGQLCDTFYLYCY